MSPLVVNVAELLRKPGTERAVHLESTLAELAIDDERLPDGPVVVEAVLDVLSDGIVVTGTVNAEWRGECRRCLTGVGGPLAVPVREVYQTRVTDPDAFPIDRDQLDLRPMVRETLLLEAPEAPLCREDCAGLCPACGVDRNATECSCDLTVRDPRWEGLETLRDESR